MAPPEDFPTVIDPARTLGGVLGLREDEISPERVTATLDVGEHLLSGEGVVHGGVYAATAEGMASFGTAVGVVADGCFASGMSNHTTVLAAISDGTLHAVATRRHAGEREWLWDVEISDDAGRPCAHTAMTIAVRPQRR